MSGVYIRGMQMPEKPILFCIHPDGKVFSDKEGGWEEYRAVPVPDHGDLIDRNALVPDTSFYDGGDWHYGYSKKTIQYAPTVIQTDKEGDND